MGIEDEPKTIETPTTGKTEEEQKGEKGALKKKIDIPGVGEIEYTEKTVMFPEKVVEETGGVKGYVRKMVSWESYNNALEKLVSVDEIKELGLLDVDVRPYLYQESLDREKWNDELDARRNKISAVAEINSIESLRLVQEILNGWDMILSGYYKYGIGKKEEEIFKEKLSRRGWDFLGEKVSSANKLLRQIIDALGDNFIKETYIHVMEGVWSPYEEINAEAEFKKKMLLQEIFDPKLSQQERSFSGGAGLSVSNGGFWSCDGSKDRLLSSYCNRPFFGFSNKNSVFEKYLWSITDLIGEEKINYIRGYSSFEKEYWQSAWAMSHNEPSDAFGTENQHPIIPVISHPDVPRLRWCHAQYAYIPTKNGFNIIEMIS